MPYPINNYGNNYAYRPQNSYGPMNQAMPMGYGYSGQQAGTMPFDMGASSLAGAIPMNFGGGGTAAVIDNLNQTLAKASALGAVTQADYEAGLAQSAAIRAARGEAPRNAAATGQTAASTPAEAGAATGGGGTGLAILGVAAEVAKTYAEQKTKDKEEAEEKATKEKEKAEAKATLAEEKAEKERIRKEDQAFELKKIELANAKDKEDKPA